MLHYWTQISNLKAKFGNDVKKSQTTSNSRGKHTRKIVFKKSDIELTVYPFLSLSIEQKQYRLALFKSRAQCGCKQL